MKSIFLDANVHLKDIPIPEPSETQALVKISYAGICNTDLELIKGYMGYSGVLGHEFCGVVVDCAESHWVGKRVCGEINFGCGSCEYCNAGLSRHCPERTVLGILNQHGAFAEYTVIPIENLREIPDNVDDLSAVFVEPLAAALEINEQLHIEPANRVAVIGDGKLGLLICQVLRLTGCDLTLVGKHSSRFEMAAAWGVAGGPADKMQSRSFDIVVEASGSPSGFETAVKLLKPRGTLVLKSTYHGDLTFNAALLVIDEICLIGSRCGRFEPALQLLASDLVDVKSMIDKIYPLAEAEDALAKAEQRGTLKVILKIDG